MKRPVVIPLLCLFITALYFLIPNPHPLLISPNDLIGDPSWLNAGKAVLACFLHGSWRHFVGNMVLISFVGYGLERKIGWKSTLGVVVSSLIGGVILHVLFTAVPQYGFLGASGIAFGIIAGAALRL